MRGVAFETINKITNTGKAAWKRDTGLPSVWILAMFAPRPDARVIVPFETGPEAKGTPIVNDADFGKVATERLVVREDKGVLVFTCDGKERGKIGLGPARAKPMLGSYSAPAKLLTVVQYDKPKTGNPPYVNSMWEKQKLSFSGDVVNSYNDGSPGPGKAPLGGFYEIETSSPGLWPLLRTDTLVEFKSLAWPLRKGDLARLQGYGAQYFAAQIERPLGRCYRSSGGTRSTGWLARWRTSLV